jgi:hypothetical protein
MDERAYTVHLSAAQLSRLMDMCDSMIGLDSETDATYEQLLDALYLAACDIEHV